MADKDLRHLSQEELHRHPQYIAWLERNRHWWRNHCLQKNKIVEIDGVEYRKSKGGRYELDGKFYRIRRGKLVEIPPGWVGKTVAPQTIAKRASKKGRGKSFKRKVRRKRKDK